MIAAWVIASPLSPIKADYAWWPLVAPPLNHILPVSQVNRDEHINKHVPLHGPTNTSVYPIVIYNKM